MEKRKSIILDMPEIRMFFYGRKNQMRFPVELRDFRACDNVPGSDWYFRSKNGIWSDVSNELLLEKYSPYQPGDLIYVREKWAVPRDFDKVCASSLKESGAKRAYYYSDFPPFRRHLYKWRPARIMPDWACRLGLNVLDVRVESLHDIIQDDALSEGIVQLSSSAYYDPGDDPSDFYNFIDPIAEGAYARMWERLYGATKFCHRMNPYVWRVRVSVKYLKIKN